MSAFWRVVFISFILGLPYSHHFGVHGYFTDFGVGAPNVLSASFADNLYMHLLSNNAFRLIFSGAVSPDVAASFGNVIAQNLAREFLIPDQLGSSLLFNSLGYNYPGAGPEVYAHAISGAIGYLLARNKVLNGYNNYQVASEVADIIISSIPISSMRPLSMGFDGNSDDFSDTYDSDIGIGAGLNAKAGLGGGGKGGLGLGAGLNLGLGLGAGLGVGAGLNADVGLGLGANVNAGLGLGLNAGLGLGANVNAGLGLGLGLNAGLGLGAGLNTGLGLGLGLGAGLNADVGVGADVKADVGLGVNADVKADVGLGIGADVGLGIGADVGLGIGADVGLGVSLGAGAKGKESKGMKEAKEVFKQKIYVDLVKDKYFRHVFSESIPSAAVPGLVSAIAQFLSKAFNIPRTYLLGLESDIRALIKSEMTSPDICAQGISLSLTNILTTLGILSPSAISIQITMATKAITGGILNYLSTSSVPGVGLGINNNPYNSYFSVLSGLEMLPYVGPDAVSRKYPPILKAAKASGFSDKFKKVLYGNLISSSKFSETFLLGLSTPNWKTFASTLGNVMAEAFGSPNTAFFVDTYANAFLSLGTKLSYKTYAKLISVATAKALYSLGYFISGNTNIQAAIASNAIIKAIQYMSKSKSPYRAYSPSYLGLSWMTPLTAAPSAENSKKKGIGLNVDAGLGVNADVGLGVNADVGLGVNADVGLGLNADVGLDVAADIAAKADVGVGLGLDAYADVNANVDAALGVGSGYWGRRRKRGLLDIDAALGVAADVNANIGAAADVGVNAALGLGADIGANINAGLGLDANVGLGLGANVGLGVGGKGGKGEKGNSSTPKQLSVLNVLPDLLADKLFGSTAMHTAMTLVGTRKVANLIGQGMAAQFGFQVASVFVDSYDKLLAKFPDGNLPSSISAISVGTSEALAAAGVLSTPFTAMTADQLATAITAKFSSLIATSLDSKDWGVSAKWNKLYSPDFIDPPVPAGYGYFKTFDDSLNFDYGVQNPLAVKMQLADGFNPKSRILM
ncbi:fibroin heavy chain-like [Parasteatoda tepidariorum]|uniref:fibroin heavy chain-like n=1 Tax=Parasteatoda tepidariorum TaxID=114398 RepID=UPI0039BD91A4